MELSLGILVGMGVIVFGYYMYTLRNARKAAESTKAVLVGLIELLQTAADLKKKADAANKEKESEVKDSDVKKDEPTLH